MTDTAVTAFHVAVERFDALLDFTHDDPERSEEHEAAHRVLRKHRDRIATYRNVVTRWGEKGEVDA